MRYKCEEHGPSYADWDGYFPAVPPEGVMWVCSDGYVNFANPKCPNVCVSLPVNGKEGHQCTWDFSQDAEGRPTLHPSIQTYDDDGHGCKAHFYIRDGEVQMCD